MTPKLGTRATALLGLAAAGQSVWGVGAVGLGSTTPNGLIALWGQAPR